MLLSGQGLSDNNDYKACPTWQDTLHLNLNINMSNLTFTLTITCSIKICNFKMNQLSQNLTHKKGIKKIFNPKQVKPNHH